MPSNDIQQIEKSTLLTTLTFNEFSFFITIETSNNVTFNISCYMLQQATDRRILRLKRTVFVSLGKYGRSSLYPPLQTAVVGQS